MNQCLEAARARQLYPGLGKVVILMLGPRAIIATF